MLAKLWRVSTLRTRWCVAHHKIRIVAFVSLLAALAILRSGTQLHDASATTRQTNHIPESKPFLKRGPSRETLDAEFCAPLINARVICPNDNIELPVHLKGHRIECGFNIQQDLEYMPDEDVLNCLRTFGNSEWRRKRAALFTKIDHLQNPRDCNKPDSTDRLDPSWELGTDEHGQASRVRGRTVQTGDPKWHMLRFLKHGYAYNLFVLTLNAALHWDNGIPVLVTTSKYRFTDFECGRGWSCLLSPLSRRSRCTLPNVDPSKILTFASGDRPESVMSVDQICKPGGTFSIEFGRCVCNPGFLPGLNEEYFYCIPYSAIDFSIPRKAFQREVYENPKFRDSVLMGDDVSFSNNAPGDCNPYDHINTASTKKASPTMQQMGFFWYHSMVTWYLHKDAPKRGEVLDRFAREHGIHQGNCVAVHVRHGDACLDKYQSHRSCLPLASFMNKVHQIWDKYPGWRKRVYLATDDPKVVEDTRDYPQVEFVTQSMDRDVFVNDAHIGVDVREEFNDPGMVDGIAKDIWAMSRCDALVGSFASSVVWVAYGIMVGERGYYPPFASVDLPWGHKKNVGRFMDENGRNLLF